MVKLGWVKVIEGSENVKVGELGWGCVNEIDGVDTTLLVLGWG